MNDDKPRNSAPGPYYVDEECIACDACVLVAEKHFKIDEESSCAFVFHQPQTKEETELCQEAMEACPVEAIHNDGKHTPT